MTGLVSIIERSIYQYQIRITTRTMRSGGPYDMPKLTKDYEILAEAVVVQQPEEVKKHE